MKKNLSVMTFMSWDEEDWNNNKFYGTIRAIALCDSTGYFFEAINCMRDGSMGKKDSNGVYDRHWYGDYINGDEQNLSVATKREVELYLKYVSIEQAIGDLYADHYDVQVVKTEYSDCFKCCVVVELKNHWWKNLLSKIRGKKLPF